MAKYEFTVTRTGIGSTAFTVEAKNDEDALYKAQELAMDTVYSEHHSDYEFDCPQINEKADAIKRISELYAVTEDFDIGDIESDGITIKSFLSVIVAATRFYHDRVDADILVNGRIADFDTIRYEELDTDVLYEVANYFEIRADDIIKTEKRCRS